MVSLIKVVEISSKLVTFSERRVLQISDYFMLRSFIKIQRIDKIPAEIVTVRFVRCGNIPS